MSRRGWPIRAQVIGLIVLTQIVSTGLTIMLVHGVIGSGLSTPYAVAKEIIGPFTTLLSATDALDESAKDKAIASAVQKDDRFEILPNPELLDKDDLTVPGRFYLEVLRDWMDEDDPLDLRVVRRDLFQTFPMTIGNRGVAVRLNNQEWLVFTPAPATPARLMPIFVLALLLFLLTLPVIAFLFWATGTLVAPLRRLASAAEGFSQDLDAPDAPERGSAEVRTVARAFNLMRHRLRAMIKAKSYTLAAIGHDLRTPLTRMRLRLESGNVDVEAMIRDVGAMDTMVTSALSFIRDGEAELNLQSVDLAALAQTVCDDIADMGHQVTFQGTKRVVARIDPALVRRALINVVENGITYGSSVIVTLHATDSTSATITVSDDGPGMSESDRENAFEPFWRGDEARRRDETTGFGLGLSIARSIVERHGGTIDLAPNAPRGLSVAMSLPVR